MRMPIASRQRRFFSFRVFIALCLFGLAITTAAMTALGPSIVWGPRTLDRLPSLLDATNPDTGASVDAVLQPGSLGPGMGFHVMLTVPAGLDGHIQITYVEISTDHDLWTQKVVRQNYPRTWPDFFNPNTSPRPARVTLRHLGVPENPGLMHASVTVHLKLVGQRPMFEGIYLVDEPFVLPVDLAMNLGSGLIEPTGAFNIDPYNRWTTGMACLFFLAIVSRILRPPSTLILEDPANRMPSRVKR